MAQSDPRAALDQHVVVVGADNTTVRLVEELIRAGEQLVVVTPRSAPGDLTTEIAALGAQLMVTDRVREPERWSSSATTTCRPCGWPWWSRRWRRGCGW